MDIVYLQPFEGALMSVSGTEENLSDPRLWLLQPWRRKKKLTNFTAHRDTVLSYAWRPLFDVSRPPADLSTAEYQLITFGKDGIMKQHKDLQSTNKV